MFLKILLYKYVLRLIPDSLWIKIQFRRKIGYWPNLKNPKTFNEKLQWLKLHDRNPLYTKLVDKYEVREFIAKTVGEEYLIPLLGVWDRFDDIDFDKLPSQFVLKCTHDSGGLVICQDKSKFDIATARKKINECLKFNYYWAHREWPYKSVKPRIIAEKYMVDDCNNDLKDYKIHCFGEDVKFILVCQNRYAECGLTEDFFSEQWEHLKVKRPFHGNADKVPPKPTNLDLMVKLSKILSKNIPFVRCDFYEISGRVFFGELTFFPASGFSEFEPKEFDDTAGRYLKLNK